MARLGSKEVLQAREILERDGAIRDLEEQIENCNRDEEYVRRRKINVEGNSKFPATISDRPFMHS